MWFVLLTSRVVKSDTIINEAEIRHVAFVSV